MNSNNKIPIKGQISNEIENKIQISKEQEDKKNKKNNDDILEDISKTKKKSPAKESTEDIKQKHSLLQKEIVNVKHKNLPYKTSNVDFECSIKYKSGISVFGVKWKKLTLAHKADEYLKIFEDGKEYMNFNISSIVILDGEHLCDKKKSFVIFEDEVSHIILVEDDYEKVKELFSYINKKKNIDDVISSVACIMEPYIFTDSTGNIIMINDLFEELTGHKKNETSGTNIKAMFKSMNNEKKDIHHLKDSLKESSNILIKKKNGDYFPFSVSIGEIHRDMFTYFIIIIKHVNVPNKSTEIVTIENLIKFGRITQLSKNKEFIEELDKQTNEIYDWIYDKFVNYDVTMKLLLKNNKELEDIVDEKNIEIEKYKSELDMLKGTKYEYKIFSIIRDEISYFFFLDFCKARFADELPQFINHVDKFIQKYNKQNVDKNGILEEAKKIYHMFIENESELELNIKDRLRDQIKLKIETGAVDHNLFNPIVSECILLLREIYEEFDNTYIAQEIKNNLKNN